MSITELAGKFTRSSLDEALVATELIVIAEFSSHRLGAKS